MINSSLGLNRTDLAIGGLLGLYALALYLWRLNVPAQYIYDEIYHAFTAAQFALGNKEAYEWWTTPPAPGVSYEWTHPPLAKLFMAAGILLFGDNSFGWRITPLIVGVVTLMVFYHLALALLRSRPAAVVATMLLVLDGLYMVQSRTAMNDIFLVAGLLGAYLFFAAYLGVPCFSRRGTLYILGAAFCLGFGLASKWPALYSLGAIGALTAYRGIAEIFPVLRTRAASVTLAETASAPAGAVPAAAADDLIADRGETPRLNGPSPVLDARLRVLLLQLAALALIPAGMYVASYAQFFAMGHDLSQFLELQHQMWWYHTNLTAGHDYGSRWWMWPLLIRPVWFYVDRGEGTIANIYNLGNPLIWWAILPAMVVLLYRFWKNPAWLPGIILLGYFVQWLPWSLSPRIMFFYHMLPSLPFGVLALAGALQQLWPRGKRSRRLVIGYLALVVLSFIFFYPIWTGWTLSNTYADLHFWVPSWR